MLYLKNAGVHRASAAKSLAKLIKAQGDEWWRRAEITTAGPSVLFSPAQNEQWPASRRSHTIHLYLTYINNWSWLPSFTFLPASVSVAAACDLKEPSASLNESGIRFKNRQRPADAVTQREWKRCSVPASARGMKAPSRRTRCSKRPPFLTATSIFVKLCMFG